jgi:hypothetical protein
MDLHNEGSMNIYVPQRAVSANGSTNQICSIPCSVSNDINSNFAVSGVYSVAMWFKAYGTGRQDDLFARDGPAYSMCLNFNTNDKLYFFISNSEAAGTPLAYRDGKWHHVVGTYDNNLVSEQIKLYMDGELVDTTTSTKGTADCTENDILLFGYTQTAGDFYGEICNFQFWSGTALDADEVKRVYSGIPVTDNRVCEFKFDDFVNGNVENNPNVIWDTTEAISGGWNATPSWVDRDIQCWCTRWDEGNWDVQIETMLNASDRNFLFDNVVPGAVRELYNVLGTPEYIDTTYSSSNTLIFEPLSGYGLSGLRKPRTIGVKSISDTFLNNKIFSVKIDGMRIE